MNEQDTTEAESISDWRADLAEPTEAELHAIAAEQDLLDAELALVETESAWHHKPSPETASAYLEALLQIFDLYDLPGEAIGEAA